MIRSQALAAVLLACACGSANAQGVAPGIYGNVMLNEESGDLGGVELELIGSGSAAHVEFVICEGWCNSVRGEPVVSTPDGFAFSYAEEYLDQDGRLADSRAFGAVVTRTPFGVTITITPTDAPEGSFSYDLEPLDDRFGLAVALDED